MGKCPAPDDIGDRNFVNIAPLQFPEETLRLHTPVFCHPLNLWHGQRLLDRINKVRIPNSDSWDRLRYSRKFLPILGQPEDSLHFRWIEDQRHEDIIGDIPFAVDFILAPRSKSKSRIVLCVAQNDDEGIARVLGFLIPRLDRRALCRGRVPFALVGGSV